MKKKKKNQESWKKKLGKKRVRITVDYCCNPQ